MRKIVLLLALLPFFVYSADTASGKLDNKSVVSTNLFSGNTAVGDFNYKKLFAQLVKNGLQDSFMPIEPIPVNNFSEYNDKTKKLDLVYFKNMSKSQIRERLLTQSATVKIYKYDESTGLQLPAFGATFSQASGKYKVIMDYMKYTIEPIFEESGKYELIGFAKVGIGLRISANLETEGADINLGSLLAIGAAANAKELKGDISISVIGIDSPDITNLIPLTSAIDQTSIQSALQAMASIKAKFNDNNIEIHPHIVAFTDINKQENTKQPIKKKCWFCF